MSRKTFRLTILLVVFFSNFLIWGNVSASENADVGCPRTTPAEFISKYYGKEFEVQYTYHERDSGGFTGYVFYRLQYRNGSICVLVTEPLYARSAYRLSESHSWFFLLYDRASVKGSKGRLLYNDSGRVVLIADALPRQDGANFDHLRSDFRIWRQMILKEWKFLPVDIQVWDYPTNDVEQWCSLMVEWGDVLPPPKFAGSVCSRTLWGFTSDGLYQANGHLGTYLDDGKVLGFWFEKPLPQDGLFQDGGYFTGEDIDGVTIHVDCNPDPESIGFFAGSYPGVYIRRPALAGVMGTLLSEETIEYLYVNLVALPRDGWFGITPYTYIYKVNC